VRGGRRGGGHECVYKGAGVGVRVCGGAAGGGGGGGMQDGAHDVSSGRAVLPRCSGLWWRMLNEGAAASRQLAAWGPPVCRRGRPASFLAPRTGCSMRKASGAVTLARRSPAQHSTAGTAWHNRTQGGGLLPAIACSSSPDNKVGSCAGRRASVGQGGAAGVATSHLPRVRPHHCGDRGARSPALEWEEG
jgi:hypothetical protein